MGIYFAQALLVAAVLFNPFSTQAQQYKNAGQFGCRGATLKNAERASKADYQRLDTELSYANKALSKPQQFVGTWKYESHDENNKLVISTIELQIINGGLYSRLINWGGGRFTSQFEPVEIRGQEAYLKVSYPPSVLPIELRPIGKNKMRYAFADHCEINFPSEWSPVFTRK